MVAPEGEDVTASKSPKSCMICDAVCERVIACEVLVWMLFGKLYK